MTRLTKEQASRLRNSLAGWIASDKYIAKALTPEKLCAMAAISPETTNYQGCLARARVLLEAAGSMMWFNT